jgi:hypothetical protein
MTVAGVKVNSVNLSDIEVVFVNSKTGFCKKYLKYSESLQFRGYLSAGAIAYAGADVLFPGDCAHAHWRESCQDARFLVLAMQELEQLDGDHLHSIAIGDEISSAALKQYDAHLHASVFPPPDPRTVKEAAGEGHEKVKVSAEDLLPMKRSGAPSKKLTHPKPYNNGWFLITSPSDGRVLGVTQQIEPEENKVVLELLNKISGTFSLCDTFICDRCSKVHPEVIRDGLLPGIKFWAVDHFHSQGHNKSCKNSPLNVPRLKRRLQGVNISVAEQVFSWFRRYSRVFNEMRSVRHRFLVLYYCVLHNEMVSRESLTHLNAYTTTRSRAQHSGSYACSMKVQNTSLKGSKAGKALAKVMKKPAQNTKARKTVVKAMKAKGR